MGAKRCGQEQPHNHGTPHCYQGHGCRCDPCRNAYAVYQRKLRERRYAGDPGRTSARYAARVIRLLQLRGYTIQDLVKSTGMADVTFYRVMNNSVTRVDTLTYDKLMDMLEASLRASNNHDARSRARDTLDA